MNEPTEKKIDAAPVEQNRNLDLDPVDPEIDEVVQKLSDIAVQEALTKIADSTSQMDAIGETPEDGNQDELIFANAEQRQLVDSFLNRLDDADKASMQRCIQSIQSATTFRGIFSNEILIEEMMARYSNEFRGKDVTDFYKVAVDEVRFHKAEQLVNDWLKSMRGKTKDEVRIAFELLVGQELNELDRDLMFGMESASEAEHKYAQDCYRLYTSDIYRPLQAGVNSLLRESPSLAESEKEAKTFKTELAGKSEFNSEELQALRNRTKDEYIALIGDADNKGLINSAHRGKKTWQEHKQAMDDIFSADTAVGQRYKAALEAGVVNPRAFAAEIQQMFKAEEMRPIEAVPTVADIKAEITAELLRIDSLDNLKLTASEQENIANATFDWAQNYAAGFPEVALTAVARLAQESAQVLAYQVVRDKEVFSGSDHGDLHILEGDYKKGMQLIESLQKLGITLTPKEKAIWGYAVFLHDIGYTAGVAQAKQSFEASKDHPVFSVSYVDANQAYISERFGDDGFRAIREIILMHSYPNAEFNPEAINSDGLHLEAMSHALALPDSLGTTAETKCPEFFRQPAVVEVLQQIRLYADIATQKYQERAGTKIKAYIEGRKSAMREIALSSGGDRAADYIKAIDDSFNAVTVDMTLGLYAGVLDSVSYVKNDQERVVPDVVMKLSESQAVLADVFGDKMSVKAFVKAMDDLGFAKSQYETLAQLFQQYRETDDPVKKAEIQQQVMLETPNAKFGFDLAASVDSHEFTEYSSKFKALEQQTLRKESRELLESLTNVDNRNFADIQAAYGAFIARLSSADLQSVGSLLEPLIGIDASTDDEIVYTVVDALKAFVPKSELDFLKVDAI